MFPFIFRLYLLFLSFNSGLPLIHEHIYNIYLKVFANSTISVISEFVSIDYFSSWLWVTFSWFSTAVLFDSMLDTVNIMSLDFVVFF